MKQLLNKALVLAATAHDGQYDRGGLPYAFHVLKVQFLLKSDDEELNCIGLLHDVVEDTRVTFEDLERSGFTKRIVDAVRLLTKKEDGFSEEDYLAGILTNKNVSNIKGKIK